MEEESAEINLEITNSQKSENQDVEPNGRLLELVSKGQPTSEQQFSQQICEKQISEPSAQDKILEDTAESRFNLRKRKSSIQSNDDKSDESASANTLKEKKFANIESVKKFSHPKKKKWSKKKKCRRVNSYTMEAVQEAVKIVQTEQMTVLEAAKYYNIPRTSLHNFVRVYKRGKKIGSKTTPPSNLTKEEEEEIVALAIKLSRCGKRYSHNELRYLVQYYLISNDRPVFKSGTLPTMGWVAGLVERQPEIVKAKSKKNTKVANEDVELWQKEIEDYLLTDWGVNINSLFTHGNGKRIFCFNAFRIAINGPAESSENPFDSEVSVILGMSASGDFETPMVILPEQYQDLCLEYDSSVLKLAFTKSGRVEDDIALQVIKDFDDELISKGVQKPIVLFVNDKQDLAHFSVIEYCWESQIIIICLSPKTSKTMTPFEINIWPKIRATYTSLWKKAEKNLDNKLPVESFPDLFLQACNCAQLPKSAIRGFIKSGIIPFNVPRVLYETPNMECYQVYQKQKQRVVKQSSKENNLGSVSPSTKQFNSFEERGKGKLEGIQMCLEAIQKFIPLDIAPTWEKRGADYQGRSELAFKLWRSVSLLFKAGCAMASIQQMADNANTTSINQNSNKSPQHPTLYKKSISQTPTANSSDEIPISPNLISGSNSHTPDKCGPKKRKLNKSIYSMSDASPSKSDEPLSPKSVQGQFPIMGLDPATFLRHSVMDSDP